MSPANRSGKLVVGYDTEFVPGSDRNEVLSYQLATPLSGTNRYCSMVRLVSSERRLPAGHLLVEFVEVLVDLGILTRWPRTIDLACHWSRADLPAFLDWRRLRWEVDGVQKTFCTLVDPFGVGGRDRRGYRRRFLVRVCDTWLLAPASRKDLGALGLAIGHQKIEIGDRIEDMRRFLREDPVGFRIYAARDAEIAAGYLQFIRDQAGGLGVTRDPPTVGSLAARYTTELWRRHGFDPRTILHSRVERETYRCEQGKAAGKLRTRKRVVPVSEMATALAIGCFHGGRNEAFCFGLTPMANYREDDLAKAYATALCMIRVPDFDNLRWTTDVRDFSHDVMGFALVRFRFPDGVNMPCLPVRRAGTRGLAFVLEGQSYATSPEIALARSMGAELRIETGFVIPWKTDGIYPFRLVVKELLERSKAAKDAGDLGGAELFKQLGNSIFGKTGQGLKGKRSYDPRTGSTTEVGRSKLTSPFVAAWVTGYVRAVLGELLSRLPGGANVVAATTDSIVHDAAVLDVSGPICTTFADVREAVSGSREFLEPKHVALRLLSWRNSRPGRRGGEVEGRWHAGPVEGRQGWGSLSQGQGCRRR